MTHRVVSRNLLWEQRECVYLARQYNKGGGDPDLQHSTSC